jgi:hypothetical protein
MAEQIERVKTVRDDGVSTTTTRTVSDTEQVPVPQKVDEPASFTAARVIWFIAGVIIVLLALRFIFVLLGANSGNGFVHFIYSLSYPFAVPFFGIFSYSTHYGVSRFEASTLVAIIVYALIAWGLARLVTIRHPRHA